MKRMNSQAIIQELLFAAAVVFLTACRLPDGRYPVKEEAVAAVAAVSAKEPETKPAGGSKEEDAAFKAGAVMEVEDPGESGFNRQIREVFGQAEKELGIQGIILESRSREDYQTNLDSLIEEGCRLIFVSGDELGEEVREAAVAHPHLWFAVAGSSVNGDLENVSCLVFDLSEASYLAGLTAGMMSNTGHVGLLSEGKEQEQAVEYSFYAGVLDANPEAVIDRIEKVPESSSDMDLVFCGEKRLEESEREALQKAEIRLIAGSGTGFLREEDCLAAAKLRLSTVLESFLKDFVRGKKESGIFRWGMYNEGIDFSMNEHEVPEEVRTAVLTVKEKLETGQILIPNTKEAFESAYGELQRRDRDE